MPTKDGQGERPIDLDYFRFDFPEAEAEAAQLIEQIYGKEPQWFRAVLPFDDLAECWAAWVDAYLASGLIYRSDGEHVLFWIDPANGDRKVKDGEPLTECVAAQGKPVGVYTAKDGQPTEVFAKPRAWLRVIVPDLVRFGYMTLVTSSQHDIINIDSQLAGVELVAKQMGRPGIAGVPLLISRRRRKITTPTPDGGRTQRETWLINIEADPEWVDKSMAKLIQDATPRQIDGRFLLPVDVEHDNDDDLLGAFDEGPVSEVARREAAEILERRSHKSASSAEGADTVRRSRLTGAQDVTPPPTEPDEPADQQDGAPGPEAEDEGNGGKSPAMRPYYPEEVRERWEARVVEHAGRRKDEMIEFQSGNKMELYRYAGWMLAECFPGDKAASRKAHSVVLYLTRGRADSTSDLTGAECTATLRWLHPTVDPVSKDIKPTGMGRREAVSIVETWMKEAGQDTLPI